MRRHSVVTIALIIGGLVVLFFGGDMLVNGAIRIAKHFGMSELLIGITLVGFGTSTPELMTTILAALDGYPGIAVGNVVGSNIANILLILGITSLVYPLVCDKKTFMRDGSFMVIASLLLLAVCFYGSISLWTGIIFLAALFGYIGYCISTEIKNVSKEDKPVIEKGIIAKDFGLFIVGLCLTFAGAHLLVKGSVDLAKMYGISDTIIGLTIVAIGTSMPELVASVMAAIKKKTDIAYGNIIGSNIYNILGIMGLTAIINPFEIPAQIMGFDIWVMIAATALLMVFSAHKWKITRWKGAVFLGGYITYTLALIQIVVKQSVL